MNEQEFLRGARITHIAFWLLVGVSLGMGIAILRSDSAVIDAIGFLMILPASMGMWGVLDTWQAMTR
jgi:hypothetical protein